jgi:hypothetical protein
MYCSVNIRIYLFILDKDEFLRKHTTLFKRLNTDMKEDPILLTLDYQHWNANEIFDAFFPNNLCSISAFETIGHIGKLGSMC